MSDDDNIEVPIDISGAIMQPDQRRQEVTIYSRESGQVLRSFHGPAQLLAVQLAKGEAAYEGLLPLHCTRIDLESGQPIVFEPPKPSPDHEWSAERRAHVVRPDALERQRLTGEIATLEREKQPRILREIALKEAGAEDRLRALNRTIEGLRDQVKVIDRAREELQRQTAEIAAGEQDLTR